MNTNIICRAASPDNDREIRDIIALFRQVHGDQYPFSGVYKLAYWRQHIGSRFVSVVLYQGEELVGHLAFQREGSDEGMIQILFPLARQGQSTRDGELNSDQINRRLWDKVEQTARSQQWRGIYFSALAHEPEFVRYGEEVLKATPIALCPGYFSPNTAMRGRSTASKSTKSSFSADILISQRLFNPSHEKTHSIYISPDRRELVEKLYSSLGITRDIKSEATKDKLKNYPLPADRLGLETRLYPNAGVLHAYVEPSLLRSQQELRALLTSAERNNTFVLVKGYDPRALETEEWLNENGFEFAGVLPFIHDRESLLFTRPRDEKSGYHLHAESVLMHGIAHKL